MKNAAVFQKLNGIYSGFHLLPNRKFVFSFLHCLAQLCPTQLQTRPVTDSYHNHHLTRTGCSQMLTTTGVFR